MKTGNTGGRKKGTIKTGGRVAGTPNKTTGRTRELLIKFVEENIDSVMADLKKLKPKERVKAFTDILKYVIPPARDKEADDELNQTVTSLVERLFNRGQETRD
ncbi:MAG: hypothetical protein LBV74_08985 [Tannerella sp.]|nr:hypothetical protein [Tannerella sp.]